MIRRLFVANRGEIAVRVVNACRALGTEGVAGVSEADIDSLAARMAHAAETIGPAPAGESYLRIDRVIAAAQRSGCDALRPGYGFLSDRPAFARSCAEAGISFVGPSAEAIESMGDKITAVRLAGEAGVPRVPASGALADVEAALAEADQIGYPILVKASAGGGGRGTLGFHREVMDEPAFIAAEVTTRWVEESFLPARNARLKAASQK